jgi:hypothetical protein
MIKEIIRKNISWKRLFARTVVVLLVLWWGALIFAVISMFLVRRI